jgi:hypothetical protein
VRSGLQYGADYVLYPRHPSQARSAARSAATTAIIALR